MLVARREAARQKNDVTLCLFSFQPSPPRMTWNSQGVVCIKNLLMSLRFHWTYHFYVDYSIFFIICCLYPSSQYGGCLTNCPDECQLFSTRYQWFGVCLHFYFTDVSLVLLSSLLPLQQVMAMEHSRVSTRKTEIIPHTPLTTQECTRHRKPWLSSEVWRSIIETFSPINLIQ